MGGARPFRGRGGRLRRAGFVLLVSAVGACGEDGTLSPAGDAALDATTAAELGETLDLQAEDVVEGQTVEAQNVLEAAVVGPRSANAPEATVRTSSVSFSVTRDCPLGGRLRVEGTREAVFDEATRTLEIEFEARKVHSSCRIRVGERVLEIDGAPGLTLTANRLRVAGVPTGPQTTTLEGRISLTPRGGETRLCEIRLRSVVEPGTRTVTVRGSVCGHEVDRTRSRRTDTAG